MQEPKAHYTLAEFYILSVRLYRNTTEALDVLYKDDAHGSTPNKPAP